MGVHTALEMPAAMRPMAIKGWARLPRVGSSCTAMSMALLTAMPRMTVAEVTMMAPVTMPPMIMGTVVPKAQRGSSSGLCQVRLALAAWRNIL